MAITLYEMHESPHARKVRLLAAELGIPLEKIARDPRKGETRSPDYLALNPNGRVPTLKEDGFVLWESPAILKYLAAKQQERGLGGRDAREQALIDQWLFWWVGGPEAAIDALAWELLIKPKVLNQPGNDPGIIADAHARLARFLPVLDKQLEGRDYIIGPLSIADFAIGPRFDRAPELLNIDIAPYRNIAAWRERLRAKPYWSTA
jgi:glutathione S-transferase